MDKLFRIFELTKDLVDEIRTRTYDAHFHDFEELILITQGSLEHYIDFKVEIVQAPGACYVSMNKMHKLVPHEDLRGWVINYQPEFIPNSNLNFYSNFFTSTNIPLSTGACLGKFTSLCEIIQGEYRQEFVDHNTICHLIEGLLSMVDAERKRNLPIENVTKATQITTFNNFLKILEENFRRDEGVSFYAGKMNMSERNLNLICKNNFQKSVSEIIETRKLIEAKNLLLHSEKTISEIGFELGYNEKSYFTRVFHAKMDVTPSRFREMTRSMIS
jgi:AraC family transcriptional regulator, transcriptional activator of pobA